MTEAQTAPQTLAATAVPRSPDTTYVVLAQSPNAGETIAAENSWRNVGSFVARTPEDAIKAHLAKGMTPPSGKTQFVAIADRYWNPRKPKVETVTTISFEEAS